MWSMMSLGTLLKKLSNLVYNRYMFKYDSIPNEFKGGRFFGGLKTGKLVQVNKQWCMTHRSQDVIAMAVPEEWNKFLLPKVTSVLCKEQAEPTLAGEAVEVDTVHGKTWVYKWIDKRNQSSNGLIGMKFPDKQGRVEVTTDSIYILDGSNLFRADLPEELRQAVKDILLTSPNKYKQKGAAAEVATGKVEEECKTEGLRYIVGIDEAGRGSWAGPLYAGAVLIDLHQPLPLELAHAQDSKALTPERRTELFRVFTTMLKYGVGISHVDEINKINLDEANTLAAERALADLLSKTGITPDAVIIDGQMTRMNRIPKARLLTQGETHSKAIAAASIIAKVSHDLYMEELEKKYPGYDFKVHQGYGTPSHMAGLKRHGVTPEHRVTFKPIRELLKLSNSSKLGQTGQTELSL